MKNEELCPCSSGKTFGECCGPVLAGERKAATAAELMRARYSAYAVCDVDFLFRSSGPEVRGEFDEKSARGYDNERRRIESWLGDYMSFGQDADGRRVFLSVDSRAVPSNPLYRAFRTKSFTDRDIMLHFQLLDILPESAS